MRLSHTELEAFHAAILELHQYRDLDEFLTEAPRILARVVPRAQFSLLPPRSEDTATRIASQRRTMELPPSEEQGWVVSAEISSEDPASDGAAGPDADPGETKRQRILLDLLRPHLELACSNARQVTAQRTAAKAAGLGDFGLTPRESDVAQWVAAGKTNAEIARILGSSARTIEKHVERVLEKLGVENRTAAALLISNGRRN